MRAEVVVVGFWLIDGERTEYVLPEFALREGVIVVSYGAHCRVAEAAEEVMQTSAEVMAAARLHANDETVERRLGAGGDLEVRSACRDCRHRLVIHVGEDEHEGEVGIMFHASARMHARQQVDAHAPERGAIVDGPGDLLLTIAPTEVSGACKPQAATLLPRGAGVDDRQGDLDGFAHLALHVILARGV